MLGVSTHEAVFCRLEDPHEADTGEEILESSDLLLCGSSYSVRRQKKLQNIYYEVLEPNDMDEVYKLPKEMKILGSHGHILFSVFPSSTSWKRMRSLT